jgi:hypothetical protein
MKPVEVLPTPSFSRAAISSTRKHRLLIGAILIPLLNFFPWLLLLYFHPSNIFFIILYCCSKLLSSMHVDSAHWYWLPSCNVIIGGLLVGLGKIGFLCSQKLYSISIGMALLVSGNISHLG